MLTISFGQAQSSRMPRPSGPLRCLGYKGAARRMYVGFVSQVPVKHPNEEAWLNMAARGRAC